jgi:tetratricopeptide (TPR) repeat protein
MRQKILILAALLCFGLTSSQAENSVPDDTFGTAVVEPEKPQEKNGTNPANPVVPVAGQTAAGTTQSKAAFGAAHGVANAIDSLNPTKADSSGDSSAIMALRGNAGPNSHDAVSAPVAQARATVQDLASHGDTAAAVQVAQKALAQNPNDPQLRAFVEMNKPAQTAGITEKTVKQRAQELLAGLRGDSGDAPPGTAIAQASILPFLSGPPSRTPAVSPAQAALLASGFTAAERAEASAVLKQAMNRVQIQDYPAAEQILNKRLLENPSDEGALRLRSYERRKDHRYQDSAADAKAAVALAPWDPRVKGLLIDDLVDLGRAPEAIAIANDGLQASPKEGRLLVARGRAHESLGQNAEALTDYKAAAEADAEFDMMARDAQERLGGRPNQRPVLPRPNLVWFAAVGTALLFFSFALFRKRGESSVRMAMREDDHALLQRGARPDAAPSGFRILRQLGMGGMGIVYEALDIGLQRTVALKKLRAEVADNPRERSRFLKEARTVAALKHPNIVEIHAIHEDAEGLFLVFEKITGETLHERLGRGPLNPAEAVGYLKQVAEALDHAHTHGVVHQDLKPGNIMVSEGIAKVMDFGIARRVAETLSTMSKIEVAGTPAYMAPEQESGGGAGPAADIFALGACAYELLGGKTPFPNGGMMMKSQKMFRPVTELRPELPKAVNQAIAKALEPDPSARWTSAQAFISALSRSLTTA